MRKNLRYIFLILIFISSACAIEPEAAPLLASERATTPPATATPPAPASQTPFPSPTLPRFHTPTASPTLFHSPTIQPTKRPDYLLFPDAEIVYSAAALDFDTSSYLKEAGGLLSDYEQYLMINGWNSAAAVVERVALENSINPRLLLALLEFQSGCVYGGPLHAEDFGTAMGAEDPLRKDLYGQLVWAAHVLSEGFYGWWEGSLREWSFANGTGYQPPADANPGTVAVQYFFAQLYDQYAWERVLDPQYGFPALYEEMFGNPWERAAEIGVLVPNDLTQPHLALPFEEGKTWAYTSGPHRAFEDNGPRAALDFAPPMEEKGCLPTREWVSASAHGLIVRSELGVVIQDLDGDGNEQTGWVIMYLHIADEERVPVGAYRLTGERIGHPSCLGGISTGTHLHIARKYNGVWIPADGPIPFVLNGWTAHAGDAIRTGTLTRWGKTIVANVSGALSSHITNEKTDSYQTPLPGE